MDEPISADARKNLGNLQVHKGQTRDGIPVVMWDAVPVCNTDDCIIADRCPYQKVGKCSVRLKYLTHVYRSLVGQVDKSDILAIFTIGFQLVPLYGHLVQFKMIEYGMNTPVVVNDKGNRIINPVYKEIRETIKVINTVMRDLKNTLVLDPVNKDILDGDGDYYDSLFEDGGEPQVSTRNKV